MSRKTLTTLTITIGYILTFIVVAVFCQFRGIGAIGGVYLWVLGPIAAIIGLAGAALYWRRNWPVARGFLGGLIGVFIIGPILFLAGLWLLMRNVYF